MSQQHNAKSTGVFQQASNQQYDINFPYFRRPAELGVFSQGADHQFIQDNSQAKYYVPPQNVNDVKFDLNEGYPIYICKDETKNKYIDDLLRWIQSNQEKFSLHLKPEEPLEQKKNCLNTDFVCWRGLLTRLLGTPYDFKDGWIVGVTLFNGTYYMCEFDTEQSKLQKANQTDKEKIMCYWGFKFEQFVTAASPNGKPVTDQAVNNNEALASVVRSRLNEHSLVYGGEVDCYKQHSDGTKHYVELKTNRMLEFSKQVENFKRYKLLKWWLQSYLIGISEIIIGMRDDKGIVHRLETYQVSEIPNFCKDVRHPWKGNVCFNFLDHLLQHIKRTMKKDDAGVVYLMTYTPNEGISIEEMSGISTYTFLPVWYTNTVGRPNTESST